MYVDDLIPGFKTAVEHGVKALSPTIDVMLERADTESDLKLIKILKWFVAKNLDFNQNSIRRLWCEFPCTEMYYFNTKIVSQIVQNSAVLRKFAPDLMFSPAITHLKFIDLRGFDVVTSLTQWEGKECTNCRGEGCSICDNTGRYGCIGPKTVLTAPVVAATFLDTRVRSTITGKYTIGETMPHDFDRPDQALDYISNRAINWARQVAGMDHDLNGEKYETRILKWD